MELSDDLIAEIREHAAKEAPRECCGLLVVVKGRMRYHPCRNDFYGQGDHFVMNVEDYAEAEDLGEIAAIVHSHPFIPPIASPADLVSCEKSGLPWVIVNHPNGNYSVIEPSGYKAPLTGREFVHGVFDCYGLAQDYFRETYGIELEDFYREDQWWEKGQNILLENFERLGFVQIAEKDLKEGDVILMQIGAAMPNHIALYIGGNKILHHATGRLSSRDVWGGMWRKCSTHYLRHRDRA